MYCGWCPVEMHGTGNNDTNEKAGENGICFQCWGGGLKKS